MYAGTDDPWGFRTRWYEQRKRDVTLAALTRPRYRRAFEPGCSIGVLTAGLAGALRRGASRPTSTTGALAAARAAAAGARPTCGVDRLEVPRRLARRRRSTSWWSPSSATTSTPGALDLLLDRVVGSLAPGGTLLACHWRHPVADYPPTGDAVHDRLLARAGADQRRAPRGGGLPPRPAHRWGRRRRRPGARAWCRDGDDRGGRRRGAGPRRAGPAAGGAAARCVRVGRGGRALRSRRSTCSWSPTRAPTAPPTWPAPRGAGRRGAVGAVGWRGRPGFGTCSHRPARGAAGPALARHAPTPTRGCRPTGCVTSSRWPRRGADLVVGTVEVDDWSAHPPDVEARWRAGVRRPATGTATSTAPTSVPGPTPTVEVGGFPVAGPRRGRGAGGRPGSPAGGAHRRDPGRHQRAAAVAHRGRLRRPPGRA